MRVSIVLASSVALGVLLSGCTSGVPRLAAALEPRASAAARAVQVTVSDNGRALRMPAGQELAIALAADQGSGYQWRVQRGDPAVLRQRGEPVYQQPPAPTGSLGANGTTTFHFAAVGKGRTHLVLAYQRPWETYTAPARSYALDVTIY